MSLLNYGFRFYETSLLYPKNTTITNSPTYLGILNNIDVEVHDAFWATTPKGSRDHLTIGISLNEPLQAPLQQSDIIGTISASLDNEVISHAPLYPVKDIQQSNGLTYMLSYIKLLFSKWL